MLFSSTVFLFLFLPICLLVNFILPNIRLKNFFLLLASLFFYAWGEGELVFLMLFTILLNYVFGLVISNAKKPLTKKTYLIFAIIGNLSILGYYKYFNFFIENINMLSLKLGKNGASVEHVALPIGISFFIFQSISYVVDVYRNDGKAQKDPLNLALYISLFPQLIAGPIVRYHHVYKQINSRVINSDKIAKGIRRFIIGLGKKVLIANTCGRVADQVFDMASNDLSGSVAWLGIICFTLQVYYDFSGYSDMAIGLGKILGFDFLENFNYPYISKSVKELWTRWHISLSTWFRDYLYFPLGGNKKGVLRTYINLFIVFFLTGLWHGASWNFIIWGLIHGVFIIIEKLGFDKVLEKLPRVISNFYTMLIFIVALAVFRSDDIPSALDFTAKMFGFLQPENSIYSISLFLEREVVITLLFAIVGSTPIINYIKQKKSLKFDNPIFLQLHNIILSGLLLLSIMSVASGTHNPFIYFRF